MGLIKKKDRKSYFAAKRDRQPFRVQPAGDSDATGSPITERCSRATSLAGVIEVPESQSPMVKAPVPPVRGARNSGIALVPSAKKSSLA